MAETRRDLIYRMTADPEGFKKGMREAGRDSKLFYRELKELEKQQRVVDEVMTNSGIAMAGFGAAVGAGLTLAARAAIEWESAWTGVAKVVDGAPDQMAALEEELRGLATTLPQTHAEIAGVAAAAGQLGVAREDIAEFTRTMVAMGVSTDLASEEAAMAMARLMNIMQTAPDDVERLGSAIVGLGNSGASTEAEITEMALRIAGAGHTVGMTEAEVLAFASALASVGVEAESGGSSISTAMIKISEAVNEGGESLETFAAVAGMTAKRFATKFRQDPAAAIDAFVRGLGVMQGRGEDVFAVLESLGLSEIRLRDALLRLAGAGDLLTESLATGNQAWEENSALMEEAGRRYGTTEAQMQMARNQLVDLGITLGETLLPAINTFLDVGTGLMSWFQDLPEPVQNLAVVLGVAATAVTLVGGAALIAVPKIHALNMALGEMGGKKASMAQKALGGVTSFLGGPWGIAIGAAVTVLGLFVGAQAKTTARTDELSSTLDEQTSAVTGNTKAWIANELEKKGALEAAQALGLDLGTVVDAIAGEQAALEEVNRVLDQNSAAYETNSASIVGVNYQMTEEERNAALLAAALNGLTGDLDAATEAHQRKAEAAGATGSALSEASGEALVMSDTLGITTLAAEDATSAFDKLDSQVRSLIDTAFALNGAERDVEAGIDAITEALEENGATVDASNEKGRENASLIEEQIAAIAQLAVTTAEQTGSAEEANAVLDEQRAALEQVLRAANFTEEEIAAYIEVLDAVPAQIETAVRTSGVDAAVAQAQRVASWLDAIDRTVTISFNYENFAPINGIAIPRKDGGIVGYADGGIPGFPFGGLFKGRGGPRDDANIVAISDGEYIVNAASTKRHKALLDAINFGHTAGTVSLPRPSHVGRFPASNGASEMRLRLEVAPAADPVARAIAEIVKLNGGGVVQDAFGSR